MADMFGPGFESLQLHKKAYNARIHSRALKFVFKKNGIFSFEQRVAWMLKQSDSWL